MGDVVYLNGRFVPRDDAVVSVYDGGFLHGAGLFETMRAGNRRIFRLDAHLERLMRSAEKLLFPVDRAQLPSTDDFQSLLARNDLSSARVRLTVTSGSVLITADADRPSLTVCATATGDPDYPPEFHKNGVAVMICPFRQIATDPLAGHKTTNYLPRLVALRAAHAKSCVEAIWFTPENLLAEGSVSNVFVMKGGTVATPPLDTPVLPGIARAVVIELCRTASIPVEERPVNIDDLLDADEVFLTNSVMQVMPVIRVEAKDIGEGKPGRIATELLTAYRALVAWECRNDG